MESYRKDAEQHGAVVALNCEVVGGKVSGAAKHCLNWTTQLFYVMSSAWAIVTAFWLSSSSHSSCRSHRLAQALCGQRGTMLVMFVGRIKTLQVKDRESGQMSAVQARMVVNAAGLYAQSLAKNLQGLPSQTVPQAFLARGHYCTMEGGSTSLRFHVDARLGEQASNSQVNVQN